MGHSSIQLSTTKGDITWIPATSYMKVELEGFDSFFYVPETGKWKPGDHAETSPPALPEQELAQLTDKLKAIYQWRLDFHAGRLRTE
jgi:hypothetical protein